MVTSLKSLGIPFVNLPTQKLRDEGVSKEIKEEPEEHLNEEELLNSSPPFYTSTTSSESSNKTRDRPRSLSQVKRRCKAQDLISPRGEPPSKSPKEQEFHTSKSLDDLFIRLTPRSIVQEEKEDDSICAEKKKKTNDLHFSAKEKGSEPRTRHIWSNLFKGKAPFRRNADDTDDNFVKSLNPLFGKQKDQSNEIYRNNLKNRNFDKEAPQNSCPERATIAERQGASEGKSFEVYRNNLKNRNFDKEAPQNSCPERATIAERQGASEGKSFEVKPTQSKTDSSGCFGIKPTQSKTDSSSCFGIKPTQSKTDSSGCFGIKPTPSKTDSSGCFGIASIFNNNEKNEDRAREILKLISQSKKIVPRLAEELSLYQKENSPKEIEACIASFSNYSELIPLISLYSKMNSACMESLAELIYAMHSSSNPLKTIELFTLYEIQKEKQDTLFREASLTVHLSRLHLESLLSNQKIESVLKRCLHKQNTQTVCLDPKLVSPEQLTDNVSRFVTFAERFLKKFYKIPLSESCLGLINLRHSIVVNHFQNSELANQSVNEMLVLRYFNPKIKAYANTIEDKFSKSAMVNLMKVLQNLANNVLFGDEKRNEILERLNKPLLENFRERHHQFIFGTKKNSKSI